MRLFEGPAPRVRAIPAPAPFLDVFVKAMIEALWRADQPFALADALVLLPNRRAAQGLMDAFASQLGGAALLPAIRPLGDLDDDPDVWGAEPISLDIPPEIPAARRRLELAQLVRAKFRAEGGEDDPARALAMADELCRLLDSAAASENVRWDLLPTLVEEIDLAAHWEVSADFLKIVTTYWPTRLAADGFADPAARRSEILLALARQWQASPPNRPIVIAGSTGSIAATRALMRVVAGLPQGVVVLPGLDADLDDAAWRQIDAQHPQASLRETLAALELDRRDVRILGEENTNGRARRVLMREALAPADATADWIARLNDAGGAEMARQALEGMSLVEAANPEEEAAFIALPLLWLGAVAGALVLGIGVGVGASAYLAQRERAEREAAITAERASMASPENLARLILSGELHDPESMQLRNVFQHQNTICGEVNGKTPRGAYVGFQRFYLNENAVWIDESYRYADAQGDAYRFANRILWDQACGQGAFAGRSEPHNDSPSP